MKNCSKCQEPKDDQEFYKNHGRCKACMRELNRDWHKENPARAMLRAARRRAKDSGLPFELELSDIKIPKVCPVLGIKLQAGGNGHAPTCNSPSIDRVKPSLGYVKSNIIVVSLKANQIKSNATVDEIEKVAKFYRSLP